MNTSVGFGSRIGALSLLVGNSTVLPRIGEKLIRNQCVFHIMSIHTDIQFGGIGGKRKARQLECKYLVENFLAIRRV